MTELAEITTNSIRLFFAYAFIPCVILLGIIAAIRSCFKALQYATSLIFYKLTHKDE
jgi:hypothetical protein